MPYRTNPKNSKEVQVLKKGKWVSKKIFGTAREALAHLRALVINVKES